MPSKSGRDDEVFVKLFVSAYENSAWKDSHIWWLLLAPGAAVRNRPARAEKDFVHRGELTDQNLLALTRDVLANAGLLVFAGLG